MTEIKNAVTKEQIYKGTSYSFEISHYSLHTHNHIPACVGGSANITDTHITCKRMQTEGRELPLTEFKTTHSVLRHHSMPPSPPEVDYQEIHQA